jgi:hypothetical protein
MEDIKNIKKNQPKPLYTIGHHSDFLARIIKIFPASIVEELLLRISNSK